MKTSALVLAAAALFGAAGCGVPAADPSQVKKLEVIVYDTNTFCASDPKKLEFQAKMVDGSLRATYTSERDYQIDPASAVWTVAPGGKVVTEGLRLAYHSPDDASPLLSKNVSIHAAMKGNPEAKGDLELIPNFSCQETAQFSAADGQSGAPATRGEDATPIEAWVTLVDTSKYGPMAAVHVVRASDGRTATYFVNPRAGRITLANRGGRGGNGDPGVPGVNGLNGGKYGHHGTNGTDGFDGGDGGNGAAVVVHIDDAHRELSDLIIVDNRGGEGGRAGAGGGGGAGGTCGSGGSHCYGASGASGSDGRAGRDGVPGLPAVALFEPAAAWDTAWLSGVH